MRQQPHRPSLPKRARKRLIRRLLGQHVLRLGDERDLRELQLTVRAHISAGIDARERRRPGGDIAAVSSARPSRTQ
jgi:hypothetical protein